MEPNRLFRRRLILTTILSALPLMSYGRQTYAACVANPAPPTFLCSGANTNTQIIDANNADVTTAPGFSVQAAISNGISITGDGAITFTDTNGSVIVGEDNGLYVHAEADDGAIPGSVTIATNGNITGGLYGIHAKNSGTGNLSITADGNVAALGLDGILAHDYAGNVGNMTITTGTNSTVTGGDDGIDADNTGGNLVITVKGAVTGGNNGIEADNQIGSADLTITTEAGSIVTGVDGDAINAENRGTGNLAVTVKGQIVGFGDGIDAENFASAADLTVTTDIGSRIVAGYDGVDANQQGTGNLKITVNGEVTGDDRGIEATNNGDGYTAIKIGAGGLVQGGSSGIYFDSDAGQDVSITNDGVIRNLSGAAGDLVIEAAGVGADIGDVTIANNGFLIGRMTLNDGDDRLTNSGVWNTRGTNQFGDGDDFVDNEGVLVAAGDGAVQEETDLDGLESFRNSGLITLVDGGAGDGLLIGDGDYEGDGGELAVDAVLGAGPAGRSDVLFIDGNVTGDVTRISVNVVDVIGANIDGITVVDVEGDTGEGDFELRNGPISSGFFTWNLRFDDIANVHELFTSGVGVGAYELAGGITGTQDIWHQTTGTLAQRQADLRPLLSGQRVMPVADFAQPVAPTGLGRVGPGFWFTGVGAWLDRDAEQDGFTLDRQQTIYGGLAGLDFATEGVGDAWLFGIFAGYVGSTLKFSETNTKWSYDGPSVGAYATYLNDAFYADVTVKADFLSISIDPEDLASAADDSDTDAVNLGGRIDAGYKFGGAEGAFIEPQATLAVVNSDIDDTEIYGGDVDFDDETSVKGRLGLRLGYDHTGGNAVVYASDVTASVWQEFNDSNDVSIVAPGFPSFGVADDTVETLGDISLGLGVITPEGWSGFIRANYQFAEDYEAITGNAGLRYAW